MRSVMLRRSLIRIAVGIVTLLFTPVLAQSIDHNLPLSSDNFEIRRDSNAVLFGIDEPNGNISHLGALFVHTTGLLNENLFVGKNAGNLSVTTGARNSAFGERALTSLTIGVENGVFGYDALRNGSSAPWNAAFGYRALYSATGAYGNAAFGSKSLYSHDGVWNSAFGHQSLLANTNGFSNSAFGVNALSANTTGDFNSAFGVNALAANTSNTANYNSAFGSDALLTNSTGNKNAAFGKDALRLNSTGSENTAFGDAALRANDTGSENTAFGKDALVANTAGLNNSALGTGALKTITTGSQNVGVGQDAGSNQDTGSDNIYIGNPGIAGEAGKIKIGDTVHTETFIDGIWGNVAGLSVQVLVNSANELFGFGTSSIRFKQDVQAMGKSSELLGDLRPVTFRYREQVAKGEDILEYGLIAEEVAEVAPDLVAYDLDGKPYSVRYQVLAPMLLNEMQKQQRTIAEQRTQLEDQRAQFDRQRTQLAGQRTQLGVENHRDATQQVEIAALLVRLETLESLLDSDPVETE